MLAVRAAPTTSAATADSYPADLVPGETGCPICATRLGPLGCNPEYPGCQQRTTLYDSKGQLTHLCGPVWRNNSCPFDGILAPLQLIRLNLSDAAGQACDQRYPAFVPLMLQVSKGEINSYEYKRGLETAVGQELWREGGHQYYKLLRVHQFDSTKVAWRVLDSARCSGQPDPFDLADDPFTCIRYTRKDKCRTCDYSKTEHMRNLSVVMDLERFLANPDEETMTRLWCEGFLFCPSCQIQLESTVEEFVFPMLLRLDFGWGGFPSKKYQTLPHELQLRDVKYHLAGVTYGNESHFTSIARSTAGDQSLFSQDGLKNHGIFVRTTHSAFPVVQERSARANETYYVREDALKHKFLRK